MYEGLVIVRLDTSIQASEIVEKTVKGVLEIGLENLEGFITVLESGRYRSREI